MTLQFDTIALEHGPAYNKRLMASPWEAADYSLVNLWGWTPQYDLTWAWQEDLVWIRSGQPKPVLWAPVGEWRTIDWRSRMPDLFPGGADFIRVPELLTTIWKETLGSDIAITDTEDQWDYLYNVTELIELKGNRFHKKKNLLNQFLRGTDHEYTPLTPEYIRQALDMQEEWCIWRDCESEKTLTAENRAIFRVLKAWEELPGLSGGAIFVDGAMSAFTIAEPMKGNRVVIHFEKGLTSYKGIYQAINQMFLADNPGFDLVNREQDMGEPGLRKAKKSYHPVDFVKKYAVRYR